MKPEAAQPPVAEGEVIAGKYRVERVLGRGGMGVVVAATHVHLRQRVAIKFLLPGAEPELVTRFMREARASARLKSQHVVRVIDVAELDASHGSAPYMVMEYLEGNDLSQILKKRGALPVEDAVDYLLQACEAVAEAHSLGIVHRDLKPANLFLTSAADGSATVKVLDFGISKDTSEQAGEDEMELTRTRAVLGSPYYMAPEQMRSTRTVDARADIYSIGVILYQLVTKAVPFKAPGFVELALMVMTDAPKKPSAHKPDLAPALEEAILRCLSKDPADRFATVADFAAAIAPFGRVAAAGSAERIARTQGVAPPASLPVVAPPPSSSVVSAVIDSGLSSGPRLAASEPHAPTATAVVAASVPPPPTSARSTQPSAQAAGSASIASPPTASDASRHDSGGSTSSSLARTTHRSVEAAQTQTPSVPPPSGVHGITTGKDAANAATASTWSAAPPSATGSTSRGNGKTTVMIVAAVAALAIVGTGVVMATRTPPTAQQVGATTASAHGQPAADPSSAAITKEAVAGGANAGSGSNGSNGAPGAVEVTAGSAVPSASAPSVSAFTRPNARGGRAVASEAPSHTGGAFPTVLAAPPPPPPAVPSAIPTAAPVAVAPPPVAPPPPPVKKGVLDIDIK